MSALRPCHAGRVGRFVAQSCLYQLCRTSPAPWPLLERAPWLRYPARIPRAPRVATALFLIAALGALLSGYAAVALGFFFTAAALFYPGISLLALPALLIWAPRLSLGEASGESLFLRIDQFVVTGLIARLLVAPREQLTSPPGHTAFITFLSAIALSIMAGLLRGTLEAPLSALLFLAQWLEFYALYVAAWTFAPRVPQYLAYAWALPLIALAAYGLAEFAWPYYEDPDVRYRTFERVLFPGQANHAAGLFALAAATGLGLALKPRYRALGVALALLSTLALGPTGSRSGALAWAAGIAAFALIRVPAFRWWLTPLGILGLAAVPGAFWARHSAPGSSMYDRLIAWKSALSTVAAYPLLGLGAGARHRSFYDNQFIMTLAESGIAGLVLLLILLFALARALGQGCSPRQGWYGAGALAGLAALSVHSLATATFIVTMTAGPFFWYAGITLAQREESP